MAGRIVYLDVDDEITTAAARIRGVDGRRVALVLPYGSRVATSRINFRLLSRDALINEKQLAVVAVDSATRALAASAGLPVFASVSEYETSLAGLPGDRPATATPESAAQPEGGPETAAPAESSPSKKGTRRRSKTTEPDKPEGAGVGSAAAGAPAADGRAAAPIDTGADRAPRTPDVESPAQHRDVETSPDDRTIRFEPRPAQPTGGEGAWIDARPRSSRRAESLAATRPRARRGSRLPLVIVLAALALVVLVGGVGAYVVLPSATILVTPRVEGLTLPAEAVTADPATIAPDVAARFIPAVLVTNEITVSDTFPATGRRVEETAAKGVVRFSNLDFLRSNTIDAGSIVSTNSGVRFRTAKAVTVPRADLVGLTVFPGRVNVNVTAVEPGTSGNVEPNTIVVVPRGEDPQALKVVNPDAIKGGTHEEFPQVLQEDVDAAVEAMTARAKADSSTIAVAKAAYPGHTVFEETLRVGEPTPAVEPTTVVGQEIESFDLEMTAQATIVAVDPAPVTTIADTLIRALVEPGYKLVPGSINVSPGAPFVEGQSVRFPVTATAQQVRVIDPDEVRQLVLGKPLDTARQMLAPFGEVELTAWPDWVTSVPTLPDRVEVRIEEAAALETPAASGSAP